MRILVTRPRPGADATAARLRALGHHVVVAPLMETRATPWQPPATPPGAILLTSAFAARLAGPNANNFKTLPTHTVGSATAAAARAAGFTNVIEGPGNVQALLESVAAAGTPDLLHLAGEDRTPVVMPPGLTVRTITVYSARLLPLATAPDAPDWVLLYSPRSAAHFAAEIDRLGHPRHRLSIAAISSAALAAAGTGWRAALAAASPDEDALLAAIAATCQKAASTP